MAWVFVVMLKISEVYPTIAGPISNPKKPIVERFAAAVFILSVVFLNAILITIGKKLAVANPNKKRPSKIKYIFP